MAGITTLFWDVGGVILTNGWDRPFRLRASEHFNLDWEDFQDRHELIVSAFETGTMTLDQYLDRTVFYRPRHFSKGEFRRFMFSCSQANPETMEVLARLTDNCKYLMGTINNESLEMNLYRIEQFGLRRYFAVFFSSCFLGMRKPDEAIYQAALRMTQRSKDECLFIDDRALNLECARLLGMRAIHYQNPAQLQEELREHGVELEVESGTRI